ncbi:MAG: SusC/RagA family TonB-linked outer membrane protein [Bacteroidota bacterium]
MSLRNCFKLIMLISMLFMLPQINAQETDNIIKGIVLDSNTGEPLIGTSVTVKGTTTGTTTGVDGDFTLQLPDDENQVLSFSYIGYKPKDVPVNNRTFIEVSLEGDFQALEEIQIVGYGVQKKRVVTGAISSVDSEDLSRTASSGLDQALQGKSAGVYVSQNSNAPGGGVSIRIRGVHSTTGGNEPLYVIDGVPVSNSSGFVSVVSGGQGGSPLAQINPDDIESIEILKDASAAAIYGTRAAAGVVLITTKKGSSGQSKVSFNSYYGIQEIDKRIDLTNAENFAILDNEIRRNAQKPVNPELFNPEILGVGTNWQDEIFRQGNMQNYNLSVSGGSEKSTYLISGNYHINDGVIQNSAFQRYSFRVNTNNTIRDWISIGNNFTYSNTNEDYVITDSETWGSISNALRQMPHIPIYLDNGRYGGMTGVFDYTVRNPVAIVNEWQQDIVKDFVLGDLNLEIKPFKNFVYRSVLGLEYNGSKQSFFQPQGIGGGLVDEISIKKEYRNTRHKLLFDNIFNYSNSFAQHHNFSIMVGTSLQTWEGEGINAQGQEFPSNNPNWDLDMSVNGTRNAGGSTWEGAYISQFGRLTYDYKNKYMLTSNIRRDGSTKFGSKNRYGIFPSFSLGWRFTKEDFLLPIKDVLTDGKIRFGYGEVGSDAIGDFRYLSLLSSFEYTLNGQTAVGYAPKSLENQAIKWESSEQYSFGTDLSFYRNKLLMVFDYYVKKTSGMLIPLPVPATSGIYPKVPTNLSMLAASFPIVNIGEVRNTGLELELEYRKAEGIIHYAIGGNISYMQNEVTDMGYEGNSFNSYNFGGTTVTRTEEGHPIGSFYGYVTDGIFQSYDEIAVHANQGNTDPYTYDRSLEPKPHNYTAPGDIRFKDLNADGQINNEDKAFIGSPLPDIVYGINLSADYKNFDLSVFVQGVYGSEIMNLNRYFTEGMVGTGNFSVDALNRWREGYTNTDMPRAIMTDPNDNIRISDRWIESGDYIRIKNIQLGYSLSGKSFNKPNLGNIRLYVTIKNLHIFTDYSGYDPDVGAFNGDVQKSGIDMGRYPLSRTFLFGVNLEL